MTYDVPPEGFNLLMATNRQLREYNIPARNLLGGRRSWDRIMRHVRFTVPPVALIEGPVAFSVPSCGTHACWAGYVDTGHSDYDTAAADYVEPHISSSSCPNPLAEATWAGLGGYTSGNLGQDGTSYGNGHPHGAWWEVLPHGPVFSNWDASAGDSISASTVWDTTTSKYGFAVIDGSHILNPAEQGGGYSGTSAEFITELPAGYYLENFGKIPFTGAYAYYGSSGRHGVGQLPHAKLIMNDVNHHNQEMAQPGSIFGAHSQDFSISQNHCS